MVSGNSMAAATFAIRSHRSGLSWLRTFGGVVISETAKQQKKDWVNIAFLSLTPIIGIVGTAAWTWTHGFHLWMPLLMMVMYALVGFLICAGYHRFFSHKTYEASPLLQALFAVFGAMAAENSLLWWSS